MFRRPFSSLLLCSSSSFSSGGSQSPFVYRPAPTYNTKNPYAPVEDTELNVRNVVPEYRTLEQKRAEEKAGLTSKKSVLIGDLAIPLASTVICISPEYKLLFIKRSKQMKFMPNLYAFPGGKVDPMDLEIATKDKSVTVAMNKNPGLSRIKERVAAFRELNEELAVALDSRGDVLLPDPEKTKMTDFSGIGSLVPFQRWVTPPQESRRFDTFFFLLGLQKEAATTVPLIPNEGEIADARWLTPTEAYDLHCDPNSGFKLPPPTQVIIHILRRNYKDPYTLLNHYKTYFKPMEGRNPLPIEPKVSVDPKTGDFIMGLSQRDINHEFVEDHEKGQGKKFYLIGDFGYDIPAGFMKETGGNVRNSKPRMYVTV